MSWPTACACPAGTPAVSRSYRGIARIYDAAMGDAAFPVIRKAFDCARRRHGIAFRSIADVGCGTGRFLGGLSPSARLLGVDRSPEMLRLARSRLRGGAVLLLQDARALRLPWPVDLITLNFAVLNYMTSARSLAALLAACRRNLKPQGWLVGDVLTGAGSAPVHGRTVQIVSAPGIHSVWRIRVDGRAGRTTTTIRTRLANGAMVEERHRQKWWPVSILRAAFRHAGFQVLEVAGMTTGSRAEDDFWTQIIARRACPPDQGDLRCPGGARC